MFGHGQIEGFEEKYGMEYRRSYRDEEPDACLVDRHEREIFPLMKRRALFSGSAEFRLYDLYAPDGQVNENVFAYSNRSGDDRALVLYNNSYYESSGWIKQSDPAIPRGDGGTRRDTLSEALSIHGDGRYFTLLREQRSGLWFIRSSRALSEGGLFVSLKGYEAQVFLDIHEVEDDARGRWARLHNDLNGRGIPDLEDGIQEIFLGELYYRFRELFKPEFVSGLHDFFGNRTGDAGSFIASLEAPAEAFIEAAGRFMGGANGQYDAWTPKDEKGVNLEYEKVNEKRILEGFNAFLDRFIAVSDYALDRAPLPGGGTAGTPAARFLKALALRVRERPLLCALALGYGLFSLLRQVIGRGARGAAAAALAFDHWRLDRRLREQFRFFGAAEDEAGRLCALMRALLSRTASGGVSFLPGPGPFRAEEFAGALIQEYYQHEDFRKLLGINTFDDVTWFSKEGFEDTLFYGAFLLTLENDDAFAPPGSGGESPSRKESPSWPERTAYIAELYETLLKAEQASGYRFDAFMDFLSGADAVPAADGEKAGAKSAADVKSGNKGRGKGAKFSSSKPGKGKK
jgi:hypothetical protein